MTEDSAEVRPDVLAAIVRPGTVVCSTLGTRPGVTPPPRFAARLAALVRVAQQIRDSGATVICGSDAGVGPLKPHDFLPYGAAFMVDRIGYPTVEALRAVTSRAARACGLGDRKGLLRAGYDADILAVNGDPLADIAALREVVAVFRSGARVG